MSETTEIGWTDSTASPWFGCTEVSPGCARCYARELTLQKYAFVNYPEDGGQPIPERSGVIRRAYYKAGFSDWHTRPAWGVKATRVLTKGFWTEPFKWDAKAQKSSKVLRVFPSLMDWLDDFPAGVIDQDGNRLDTAEVLARLLDMIRMTPNIHWQLLTKRIELFVKRMDAVIGRLRERLMAGGMGEEVEKSEEDYSELLRWLEAWVYGKPPKNVWLGVSVENQPMADKRIPILLDTPAYIRFLSVEPLLEAVRLTPYLGGFTHQCKCKGRDGVNAIGFHDTEHTLQSSGRDWFCVHCNSEAATRPACSWVIVGGESGKNRRDCGVTAIESVVLQCAEAGTRCYCKQDSAFKSGQKGRLSDTAWAFKEFPL